MAYQRRRESDLGFAIVPQAAGSRRDTVRRHSGLGFVGSGIHDTQLTSGSSPGTSLTPPAHHWRGSLRGNPWLTGIAIVIALAPLYTIVKYSIAEHRAGSPAKLLKTCNAANQPISNVYDAAIASDDPATLAAVVETAIGQEQQVSDTLSGGEAKTILTEMIGALQTLETDATTSSYRNQMNDVNFVGFDNEELQAMCGITPNQPLMPG